MVDGVHVGVGVGVGVGVCVGVGVGDGPTENFWMREYWVWSET